MLGTKIIESVDSICRDSADTQYLYRYMLIQTNFSKSPKQLTISLYNTLPFIFECFPDEKQTQWR